MRTEQLKSGRIYWSYLFIILQWPLMTLNGCKDGGIFSKKSTIYGTVTEVTGAPVDSVELILSVAKGLGNIKPLFRITTDKEGKYETVVDVPRSYEIVEISMAQVDNPAYTSIYRGYEVYKEGKRVNDCCTAMVGKKTRYDFKVYK